jgi:hypothetical protein
VVEDFSSLLRVGTTELFENAFISGLSKRNPLIGGQCEIVRSKRFIHRNTVAVIKKDCILELSGGIPLISGQFVIVRSKRSIHRNAIGILKKDRILELSSGVSLFSSPSYRFDRGIHGGDGVAAPRVIAEHLRNLGTFSEAVRS